MAAEDPAINGTARAASPIVAPTGELRIRAERIGFRTAVVDAYRTAPFHLGLPSDRAGDGSAELIVQGVGPGYLPGDRLAVAIAVGPGASLTVRGQGATKVYPSPLEIPAEVAVSLSVATGARLVYLPGELIPFRQAVLEQTTTIEVAAGGRLAVGEVLTPGRVAMGEANAFTRLRLDTAARLDDRLVLLERIGLEPARRSLTSPARHGGFAVSGTICLIGHGWELPSAPDLAASVTWAVAEGDGYAMVRLLGPTAQSVMGAMRAFVVHGQQNVN